MLDVCVYAYLCMDEWRYLNNMHQHLSKPPALLILCRQILRFKKTTFNVFVFYFIFATVLFVCWYFFRSSPTTIDIYANNWARYCMLCTLCTGFYFLLQFRILWAYECSICTMHMHQIFIFILCQPIAANWKKRC